jgi:hypothetical protein
LNQQVAAAAHAHHGEIFFGEPLKKEQLEAMSDDQIGKPNVIVHDRFSFDKSSPLLMMVTPISTHRPIVYIKN